MVGCLSHNKLYECQPTKGGNCLHNSFVCGFSQQVSGLYYFEHWDRNMDLLEEGKWSICCILVLAINQQQRWGIWTLAYDRMPDAHSEAGREFNRDALFSLSISFWVTEINEKHSCSLRSLKSLTQVNPPPTRAEAETPMHWSSITNTKTTVDIRSSIDVQSAGNNKIGPVEPTAP